MTNWVTQLQESIPEFAKDIKLNLDAVINRSEIDPEYALHIAIASAFATGNSKLLAFLVANSTDELEKNAALGAGAVMAQNNVWYPYSRKSHNEEFRQVNGQLRMNIIGSHGGTTKAKFESYALAASIIGKCDYCVSGHFDLLKNEGYTNEQLRDIGRIAATINALAKILNA
jgi:alkyl hydroperoxide reductase subunit D